MNRASDHQKVYGLRRSVASLGVILFPLALVAGCAASKGALPATQRSHDVQHKPTTRTAQRRGDYLSEQVGNMAAEDAEQARPKAPPAHPRRRPEPIQRKPLRPVDQPRIR